MLYNQGSPFTPYDGGNPSINVLATRQSPLHANISGQPGYSLTGNDLLGVTALYAQYDDGYNNALPTPSDLDLGGQIPSIAPSYFSNSQPQNLPYILNQPE